MKRYKFDYTTEHWYDDNGMSPPDDAVLVIDENYDPTPWCSGCGAMKQKDCHCGPIAEND